MSFDANDLSVLAYANGFTLWHYRSGDAVEEVRRTGYFARAGDLLRAGDVIIASASDGADGGLLRVSGGKGGAVEVAELLSNRRLTADGAS